MESMGKARRRGGVKEPSPPPAQRAVDSPAPAPPRNLRPHVGRVLALIALALLVYANSFRAGMTLDNATIILQDSRIQAATDQNLGLIFSQEYWYGHNVTDLYRPFTTLTYLFNYAILGNGPDPAGYHAVNFAIHAANIVLVYLLGLLIFRRPGPALALAGLWAVHPVLTESVTNIVGRADLLAGFGVLAALLCHTQAAGSSGRRRAAWLAGIALATAIGIFSKESAIAVLAVLPLYDWLFGGRDFRGRIAGYIAMLPAIAAYFCFRTAMMSHSPIAVVPFGDNPLVGADFVAARLTAIKVIGKLFLLCLWPAALSCDYSYNQIPLFSWSASWPNLAALLSLAACTAAAVAAWKYRRRAPALAFFIAFWFVALAPTANIAVLIGTIMAERFLYLPSIAFAGCAVLAIGAIARRLAASPGAARRTAGIAVALICLAYALRTVVRNGDWRDDLALFRSAVNVSPASLKTHSSYAIFLADKQPPDLDAAVHEAGQAMAILSTIPDDRNSSFGFYQAGHCYRRKGEADAVNGPYWLGKARDTLLKGEQISRLEVEQLRQVNLAAGKGPFRDAQPRQPLELAKVYQALHQPKDAIAQWEDARAIRPAADLSETISQTYRSLGDREGAVLSLLEGLVFDPNANGLAPLLVKDYRDLWPDSCAITQSGGSYSLNLQCPLVHDHLCRASANVARQCASHGQPRGAARTAQNAITQFGCPASMFQ